MEKVRFGIVGMGNQGTHYARLLSDGEIKDAELSAVCDGSAERLKDLKRSFPQAQGYLDPVAMMDSGNVDAVIVSTPHAFHTSIVKECLRRNLHVVCDKPAGVYAKEVREMNELAKKTDVKFTMMFNQRTNCIYRKMRELILGGELGQLQRVTWIITDWFRTQAYYDARNWRATWAGEGGGVLINQCPHQLDLLQWVIGETPKTVRAFCHYGKWHDIEVEDDVTAYFEYESGATGVFITTTGEAPGTNRLEINGSKGKLLCVNGQLILFKNSRDAVEISKTSDEGFDFPDVERIEVETDGRNSQHQGVLSNFAQAILGKEELWIDGTEGIKGVQLMNAITLSGWKDGQKVVVPVDEDEYLERLKEKQATSRIKTGCKEKIEDVSVTFKRQKG